MLLENKAAIVTGAAAGIGLAVAERLAGEGAAVVLADIDVESGEASAQKIRDTGGRAWFVRTDIGDLKSIENLFSEAVQTLGRLDILVNNAGVTKRIGILDITADDWDWIQTINTRGMFFCLQHAARYMKDNGGGRIVNLSSVSGKGHKGASNASYATSKAAAIVVARVAAKELGEYNINVNSVCPGVVMTPLMSRLIEADPDKLVRRKAEAALGRVGEPQDIADAVLFLSSDMARNITGQSLNVDCGLVWD